MRPDEGVVARRYARALLMLCKERGDSDVVLDALKSFASALDQVPLMKTLLESPLLTRPRKLAVLTTTFQTVELPLTAKEFLFLLVKHGRLESLRACVVRFGQLLDTEAGRVRASVWTPTPLTEGQKTEVVMALTRLLKQRVLAGFSVDTTLLGGVVARVGNTIIDSSIKGKLEKLRHQLSSHS